MISIKKLFQDFGKAVCFSEPLSRHTSFRIGGPAAAFALPASLDQLISLLERAREGGVPVFVLGQGANILVSDKGFGGLVVSLEKFSGFEQTETTVRCGAGLPISFCAEKSAEHGLKGIERFYSMPGSVGGSVWMNARCYETSVSDSLSRVSVLDKNLGCYTDKIDPTRFDYKKSPFQTNGEIILEAEFALEPADPEALQAEMREIRSDRETKGHFGFPSAGSVFKNNRSFGRPTGAIIDSLGLKGRSIGGAQISPLHANIIINKGNATAKDVKALVSFIEGEVEKAYGFVLEREILYVGEE